MRYIGQKIKVIMTKETQKFYKFRPFGTGEQKKIVADIVLENKLFFASAEEFLDPSEFMLMKEEKGSYKKTEKLIRRKLKERSIGVLSLSKSFKNVLMWSFYADWHSGLCIEFKAGKKEEPFCDARKVKYMERVPSFELGTDVKEKLSKALFIKSSDWSHEKEWRVVRNGYSGSLLRFPSSCIRQIIIGCRMPNESVKRICEWKNASKSSFEVINSKVNKKYEVEKGSKVSS